MKNTLAIKSIGIFFFSILFIGCSSFYAEGYNQADFSDSIDVLLSQNDIDSAAMVLLTHKKALKESDKKQLADIYWKISNLYEDNGMLDSALKYVTLSWDLIKKTHYIEYFDSYLSFMAYCYWEKGNYSKSLSYLMEAERNIEHADSINIRSIYNTFGLTYSQLGNFHLAEKYYNKSLVIAKNLNKKSLTGVINANLGRLYYNQGKLEKALNFFERGSKLELETNNHSAAGRSFSIMANIYLEKDHPKKARRFLKEASRHNKLANDNLGLCRTNIGFGNLYLHQKKYNKAEGYFLQAGDLAINRGSQKELIRSFKGLFKTYNRTGQHEKACEYLQKYHQLYKKSYNINEIIKAEKLQYELNIQNEINKRQKAQLKNQKTVTRLLIIILSLIIILAIILSIMIIRGKRIRNYLEKKNAKINHQKNELQKLNKELNIAKRKTEETERLKDQFLRNMSHEIRTPLNGIMGFSSVIAENDTTPEERTEYHQMIEQNAKTLLNTIDDILDIAKIKTQQIQVNKQNMDVNALLLELKKLFSFDRKYLNKSGLKFVADINEPECIIHTDPYKVRRILLALIDNSLKFTNKGVIKFGYSNNNSHIQFFVKDTGIGISPDSEKDIFNSFNQLENGLTKSYQGIGLGLTIAKSFVEILDGKIWFDSESNNGTIFYFSIPTNMP